MDKSSTIVQLCKLLSAAGKSKQTERTPTRWKTILAGMFGKRNKDKGKKKKDREDGR